MNKSKLFLPLLALLSFFSCVKNDFDAPPADGEDPDLVANTSIFELKQLFTFAPVQITDDLIISGVVISSDKSGNFYKSLIIQDATAGILIRIDQTDLYTQYPIGRRVFVKCKNLWMGDYNGLIQLGGYVDNTDPQNPSIETIPSTVLGNYLVKGKYNIPVIPLELTIGQLDDAYQNMLIKLSNVEFSDAELGKTYADPVNEFSENRTIKDCNGFQVLLRTSGFASFAGDTVPQGHGSATVIYSVFGADKQLYINFPSDLQFTEPRCFAGAEGSIISIRNLYSGTNVTLGQDKTIKGIVISDRSNSNIDSRNMVLQDSTGGIVVRFSSTHNFNLNDEVEVDISGRTITSFSKLVQVDAVPNANATKTGTGSVTPRTATISQIIANGNAWESTLVNMTGVTISSSTGTTYAGTTSLSDGTGSIDMFTRTGSFGATFANTPFPTGTVNITGIVGRFNNAQINIRNTGDVQ